MKTTESLPWKAPMNSVDDELASTARANGFKVPRNLRNDGSMPIVDVGGNVVALVVSGIDRSRKTPYDAPDPDRDHRAELIVTAVNAFDGLVEALRASRRYVVGAYECAFPDAMENEQILSEIDDALRAAGIQGTRG